MALRLRPLSGCANGRLPRRSVGLGARQRLWHEDPEHHRPGRVLPPVEQAHHIALERTASAIHPTDLHPDADVGAGGGAAGGDGGDLAAVRQLEPEAP